MRAVHQIAGLRDAITRAHNDDWTAEAEVTHLSAAAWATWAQGQPEEALRLMRRAADLEDARQFTTPGRLVPARELLGELLLALQRPAEALTVFAASQQRAPERFRGLYGTAQAAAHSGDMAQAQRYFGRLVAIAGRSSLDKTSVTIVRLTVAKRLQILWVGEIASASAKFLATSAVLPTAAIRPPLIATAPSRMIRRSWSTVIR